MNIKICPSCDCIVLPTTNLCRNKTCIFGSKEVKFSKQIEDIKNVCTKHNISLGRRFPNISEINRKDASIIIEKLKKKFSLGSGVSKTNESSN